MAGIDLVDETYIAADIHDVHRVVADPNRWASWFPDLELAVFMDRGLKGIRWSVTGKFVGSTEIWLEDVGDGVVLHYYLRIEPTADGSATAPAPFADSPAGWRGADRVRVAWAKRWKQIVWDLKDHLEGDRLVGTPSRARHSGLPS